MTHRRTLIGTIVTGLWLAAMVLMYLGAGSLSMPVKLNEWGDFFAGFFAPIAFLWLVLGYLQQGQELQLSTRALELQAEELRNSVDQQRQLVELTRKQVDAELDALREERTLRRDAAQPKFVFNGVGASYNGNEVRYQSYLQNVGNTATELSFSFDPPMKFTTLAGMPSLSRGIQVPFEFVYETTEAKSEAFLLINYIDATNQVGKVLFRLLSFT
jgi:hypothetical protein